MRKFRKSLLILAISGLSISGLFFAAHSNSNVVEPVFATYTNHDAATYYSGISDSLTGTSLLSALQSLNSSKRKSTVGYSAMGTDPSGQFKYTDYDPATVKYDSNNQPYGTKLITFYSGNSATSGMNREHVWPKSHGGNTVEKDIHMPRPTLTAENGKRGNSFYVEGKCNGTSGWDPAEEDFGLVSYRGDSARIIFYCVVANSQLSLLEADQHSTSNSNPDYLMGRLSHLIKWHLENPVQQREMNRNEGAEYLQGNRNPFIDHRSYACKIWGNTNSETKKYCNQYNGWTDDDSPTPAKSLSSLSYSGTPTKTSYIYGENFSASGLIVTASFTDGSTQDVTSSVTWSNLNLGSTSVTGTYTYLGVSKTVTVSGISVKEGDFVPVTGVQISKTRVTVAEGEKVQLSATVVPSNATNKNVTWSSSDTMVASVSNSGLVTGFRSGEATITVKSENGNFTDTCTVTVTDEEPQPVRQLVEIAVENYPNKTVYNVGDSFDKTGLVVKAHYLDGSEEDITNDEDLVVSSPNTASSGPKVVSVRYGDYKTSFRIQVVQSPITELKIVKYPAKTAYFADEEFNPIGLRIEGHCQNGSVISDVTQQLNYSYDFSESGTVTASIGSVTKQFEVEILTGTPSDEHKAAEFTYVFEDKLDLENVEVEDVTLDQWKVLEYYYNQLDNSAKEVLKNIVTKHSPNEVGAEENLTAQLKECAENYDEIYLAHESDGFRDFMNRKPVAGNNNNGFDVNKLVVIGIIVGVCLVVCIVLAIAIPVGVSKSKKRKNA